MNKKALIEENLGKWILAVVILFALLALVWLAKEKIALAIEAFFTKLGFG